MTRKLAWVAMAGLIGSATFLTIGIGLASDDRSGMNLWGAMTSTCGPAVSARQQVTLPFTAVDSLAIALPASVRYQPGGEPQAVVSGNPALLDHVRLEGGRLILDCDPGRLATPLTIRVSGPAITTWKLLGSEDLALSQIAQPQLSLVIRGSGGITVSGVADNVDLNISGSGTAMLKDLTAQSAQIDVRGHGDAQITAKQTADVSISGSGNVELFGNPLLRRSEIRGSGHIIQQP